MDFLQELKSLAEQLNFPEVIDNAEDSQNIVIAGMGGSGIAGKIFSELYSEKPVINVDDYNIPEFVDSDTLFISMSYSGNTEEIIAATRMAEEKGARVVVVTSGGKLREVANEVIEIPSGLQPRSSLGYMLVPLLRSFLGVDSTVLSNASKILREMDSDNAAIRSEAEELLKNQYIPVIYGTAPFRNIAYRWRTQFNENAKILAMSNYFPELNHNELIPLRKTYRSNEFRFYTFDCEMPEKIRRRVDATEQIGNIAFRRIKAKGDSIIENLFYLIHYGDYLSYHLAMLRGVDPKDVTSIEELKRVLG